MCICLVDFLEEASSFNSSIFTGVCLGHLRRFIFQLYDAAHIGITSHFLGIRAMCCKAAELHQSGCTNIRVPLPVYAASLGPVGKALLCSAVTLTCFSMEVMAELQ